MKTFAPNDSGTLQKRYRTSCTIVREKCKGVPEVFILLENEMQILSKVVSGFHVRVLPVKEENKISNNDLRKLSVRKTN